MANDNHLFSVTCSNVTMTSNKYYNDFFEIGQQKLNFYFFELHLPDDDPVYILKKVMKEMDFSSLMARNSEVRELLEKAKEDPLYIVVLLTTYYGFRRSEVLGLRWSAIDFEAKCC